MWPTSKLKQIAEDTAERIEVSTGALTAALSLMAAGIALCLVALGVLLVRSL